MIWNDERNIFVRNFTELQNSDVGVNDSHTP